MAIMTTDQIKPLADGLRTAGTAVWSGLSWRARGYFLRQLVSLRAGATTSSESAATTWHHVLCNSLTPHAEKTSKIVAVRTLESIIIDNYIDTMKTKLAISIVSMLLYSNTLKHGFVYDDR